MLQVPVNFAVTLNTERRTGKFMCVLRGHVQAVYQLAWSADSRLVVSGSADSTLKVRIFSLALWPQVKACPSPQCVNKNKR